MFASCSYPDVSPSLLGSVSPSITSRGVTSVRGQKDPVQPTSTRVWISVASSKSSTGNGKNNMNIRVASFESSTAVPQLPHTGEFDLTNSRASLYNLTPSRLGWWSSGTTSLHSHAYPILRYGWYLQWVHIRPLAPAFMPMIGPLHAGHRMGPLYGTADSLIYPYGYVCASASECSYKPP
jgi:hypothetical protein